MNWKKSVRQLLVLGGAFSIGVGQTITISGIVRDKQTGEHLPFANIVLSESGSGTTSNRLGFFSLKINTAERVHFKVSYIGYSSFDTSLIKQSEDISIIVDLDPNAVRIEQVEVIGQSKFFDKSLYPSTLIFHKEDLAKLPSPGSRDLLRALQHFPGITFQSEMSSSIYIRGGTPDQTLIQLDGITVYNPSHVFGFFSMFNNDVIRAVKVMKGGFPAEWGTRNGSVLDILSIEGDRNNITGRASFGLVNSSMLLNGPLWKGSWMISARRSYFDLIQKTIGLPVSVPDYFFHDLHGKLTQQIDENNKISATVLYNLDDLEYVTRKNNDVIDEAIYSKWSNRLFGFEWGSSLWSSVFLRTIVSNSQYRGNLDATQNVLLLSLAGGGRMVNYFNDLNDFTAKAEIEYSPSIDHNLKAGVFLTNYDISYSTDAAFEYRESRFRKQYSIGGLFIQDELKAANEFTLTPGLRLTSYSATKELFWEPRMVIGCQLAPTLLAKLGTGLYYQWLNGGQPAYFLTFSGIDFWFPVGDSIPPSRSFQVSGDLIWTIESGLTLTLSGYKSTVSNLVELKPNFEDSEKLSDAFFLGRGENYGLEAHIESNVGELRGMMGYTLSWANRWFDGIDNGLLFPARHDKRHIFDVVASYKASETWELSLAWTFSTGQAYTGILGYYGLGSLAGGISQWNSLHYILGKKNGFRLPHYHRLDLGATKTFVYDSWKLKLKIDIFNAYSRRNALGATTGFSSDPYYRFLPIVPTVTLEAEF